jgi:hypothetical protein
MAAIVGTRLAATMATLGVTMAAGMRVGARAEALCGHRG